MLDINIWKHSYATQKGSLLGPFLSGLVSNENIGHVDLVLTVPASRKKRQRLKNENPNLPFKELITFSSKKIVHSEKKVYSNLDFVKNEFERVENISVMYSHSFWPESRPTYLDHAKCLLDSKKGLKPKFNDFFEDLIEESKDVKVKNKLITPETQHLHLVKINQQKHKVMIKKLSALDKKLNAAKINASKLRVKLKELKDEEENGKSKIILLEKINKCQNGLGSSNENMDLYIEELNQANKVLDKTTQEILICQQDLIETNKLIQMLQYRRDILTNRLEKIALYDKNTAVTEGKNPDYVISLPTTSSKLPYHLKEKAMLKKMNEQKKMANYNLFSQNCCHIAKDCIIAGITPNMKRKIIALGAPKDFFKLKFETPLSLYKWSIQLQTYIIRLNAGYHPSDRNDRGVTLPVKNEIIVGLSA